jgi:hypothetical protein
MSRQRSGVEALKFREESRREHRLGNASRRRSVAGGHKNEKSRPLRAVDFNLELCRMMTLVGSSVCPRSTCVLPPEDLA